ncbi:hypothetical protein AGMMS49928_06480 [Spirochaetia bacterium]|nr:hypothetical protein AGMMS49928_06480 [Spirochaetia bacterium]
MRVFLCAFTEFSLAIPIQSISSLLLYTKAALKAVTYNRANENTYYSLPHIFGFPKETIKHGIVLKNSEGDEDNLIENRNILLTTEVERETDIPEETIYPMPRVLKGMDFSQVFSGIQFASLSVNTFGPVLVLNPESLVRRFTV